MITSANGPATDQKRKLANASPWLAYPGRGSPAAIARAAASGGAGRAGDSPSSTTGTTTANATPATSIDAEASPRASASHTSAGATVKPATLAPFSARLIAMPRRASNHSAKVAAMAATDEPDQPTPITRKPSTICHGAVAWPATTAPTARHAAPAGSTTCGPTRCSTSGTRVISPAPTR